MANGKGSKSPAKRNKRKARIKAASAKAAAAAKGAANRSLGAGADGSGGANPQTAAMSAAASAATNMGVSLAKPGQVSAGEARAIAEAAASTTAERLGVKVAQSGKLNRSEALQAVGLALAEKGGTRTRKQIAASRQESATAAEARMLARLDQDTDATLDRLEQQAKDASERFLPKFSSNPTLSRQEAVAAATNYIMDRLGYPKVPVLSRREAAEALGQRQRANSAPPPPVSRRAAFELSQEARRPRSRTI